MQHPPIPEALKGVKALTFDVFGTTVDWRSTVHGELVARARAKMSSRAFGTLPETVRARLRALSDADWGLFAQQWRDAYMVFTRSFVLGVSEWKDIDAHHYDSLVDLLREWGLEGVYGDSNGPGSLENDDDDAELRELSLVWHRLRPWDDSPRGLRMLGRRYVTCTLSNGTRTLLEDLNARGELGFGHIVSTADFGAYKPHPSTYLGAVKALGCKPSEVAMVAAHLGDLQGARENGLRTIYVERDREETWPRDDDRFKEAQGWVDLWVSQDEEGFVEVARRLGMSA